MGGKPSLLAAAVMTVLVIAAPATTNTTTASTSGTTQVTTAAPVTDAGLELAATTTTVTHHFITNLDGDRRPADLGFNIFDVGPTPALVNALPAGVYGMVWLGQKCPTAPTADFKDRVRALAANRKVYGYYLSDEPHIATCPNGPAALKARADFIRTVSAGRQKSFIALEDRRDMRAFRPYVTHVDLVGIDPYPCSIAKGCVLSKINARVTDAIETGIPKARLVPIYQAFGQNLAPEDRYYAMPTPSQMKAILDRWHLLLPTPRIDYAYSWGHQSMSNPTLVDKPLVQQVFANHFARY